MPVVLGSERSSPLTASTMGTTYWAPPTQLMNMQKPALFKSSVWAVAATSRAPVPSAIARVASMILWALPQVSSSPLVSSRLSSSFS